MKRKREEEREEEIDVGFIEPPQQPPAADQKIVLASDRKLSLPSRNNPNQEILFQQLFHAVSTGEAEQAHLLYYHRLLPVSADMEIQERLQNLKECIPANPKFEDFLWIINNHRPDTFAISCIPQDALSDSVVSNTKKLVKGIVGGAPISHIKRLLADGANPHFRNEQGESLLHMAAMHSGKAVINVFLLEQKVDPGSINNLGWTPLMNAVFCQNHLAIDCLLAPGLRADLRFKQKNTEDDNVYTLAMKKNDFSALSKLLAYQLRRNKRIELSKEVISVLDSKQLTPEMAQKILQEAPAKAINTMVRAQLQVFIRISNPQVQGIAREENGIGQNQSEIKESNGSSYISSRTSAASYWNSSSSTLLSMPQQTLAPAIFLVSASDNMDNSTTSTTSASTIVPRTPNNSSS